ncbi:MULTISPECIES: hypothetical protein [Bartonella]|uniref:Uncharacterized protein n=4 Tax=Bartonella TaxID=773 RepID=E6Z1E8_BARSR|nr:MULTISPECIES: hypothetical protein [Bartonella]AQX31329.1 hypothetical protein BscR1v2_014230 [Bartonella schoenbuchensis R1]ENN90611.1 hypothetical protein m07a_12290 [Bartonella schoenbuchensis m07a]MBA9082712.1 hypothetical protein [Bartonella chomelii]CBI82936.1 conserved hypothetical protein [Bartonella schoenbuchensis R1]CDP79428.1 hypothetical protein BN1046_00321 [Bartonella schoenbuchensis]
MKDIPFVKEDEILIILGEDADDDVYVGPIDYLEEVLDLMEQCDAVQRFLRLDLKTLHADDVSEQVAEVYMKCHDLDEQDGYFHPFILDSDVYHEYLEDKATRVYQDSVYGSYEEQHRLRPCDVLDRYWR